MSQPQPRPNDPAAGAAVEAALQRLKRLHPQVIDLGLDRVFRLLAALGDPHLALPPVVHIAGTNGKGSTVAFLRAALEAAGRRVHAYTSPHLVRFNERIRLAGAEVDDARLADALTRVEAANGDRPITFFEATTAAAFLLMAETPADAVLLETGLGGRLDATNVLDRPAVTAITPIGMDHMAWLGDTIDAIAAEKAGILKPGVPAVVAPQPDEAMAAIAARAAAIGTPLDVAGTDWRAVPEGDGMFYESAVRRLRLPRPALAGRHQIVNAGTAIAVLDRLPGLGVPDEAVAQGLSAATWPARLQRLAAGRLAALLPPGCVLWVDSAHNRQGADVLADFLRDTAGPPTSLVVGMYDDKRVDDFLAPFRGLVERVLAVEFTGERPCLPADRVVAAAAASGIPAAPADDMADAIARLGPGPWRLVVCGSIALAGRVLAVNDGIGSLKQP